MQAWPGASFTVDRTRPHPRIILRYRDKTRFVVASNTGSDKRGPLNMLATVRKELAGLGAQRL